MLLAATTGERLTPARLIGFALILAGVVVVASGEDVPGDANPMDGQHIRAKKTWEWDGR